MFVNLFILVDTVPYRTLFLLTNSLKIPKIKEIKFYFQNYIKIKKFANNKN